MIDRDHNVSEDELHAYVDGELPDERRGTIEAWLTTHAEDASKVAAWRSHAELLRARYGGVAIEKPPGRLNVARLACRRRNTWLAAASAAALVAFVAGGTLRLVDTRRGDSVAVGSYALHRGRA